MNVGHFLEDVVGKFIVNVITEMSVHQTVLELSKHAQLNIALICLMFSKK